MKNASKGKIIKGCAVFIDVAVPLAATLAQFPIWIEQSSSAAVSGLFLIFAFLSCLPFLKQIKDYMKSPSAWAVWIVLFVLLTVLSSIISQMITVCFAGMLANIAGALIYKLGELISARPDREHRDSKEGGNEQDK